MQPVINGTIVTPKPWEFGNGRYANVTPGQRYEVLRVMSASEWHRESVSPEGTYAQLVNDNGDKSWFAMADSHWSTL